MIIKHSFKDYSVFVSSALIEQINLIARNHLPNEFGGILTGIKKKNYYMILDFEIPLKYKQSRTGFTRYPESLNIHLAKLYKQSYANLEYIGEWHTHAFSSTNYSANDLKSMKEISNDPQSKTENPVLIIIGIDKKKYNHKLFQIINQELIHFNKIIKI